MKSVDNNNSNSNQENSQFFTCSDIHLQRQLMVELAIFCYILNIFSVYFPTQWCKQKHENLCVQHLTSSYNNSFSSKKSPIDQDTNELNEKYNFTL